MDRSTSVVRQRHFARMSGAPARAFSGFRGVRTPAGNLYLQPVVLGGASWGLALRLSSGAGAQEGVLLGPRGVNLCFGTDDALVVLREKAAGMFAHTPNLNDIVERTRQMLIDGVRDELLGRRAAAAAAH